MYLTKLKEMFTEVTQKKNLAAIPLYYHPEFLLFTNGMVIDYNQFLKSHEDYYATPISYEIAYDETTLLEQGEKVAGRVWITTRLPNESPKKIEVMLIAEYKEEKLYRLWELTFPDWSKMNEFN